MSIMDMLFAAAGGIGGAEQYWISVLSNQAGYAAYGYGACADANGGAYVIGSASNGEYESILLVRYGPEGAIQWQRIFGVAQESVGGTQVSTDASGGLYFTGTAGYPPTTVVAKCNASGVLQWQQIFGAGSSLYASASTTDAAGNTYLVAVAQVGQQSATALAKYDTSGALQWQRKLKNTSSDSPRISVDGSGGVYVVDKSYSESSDLCIAKYDTSGALQYLRSLSSADDEAGPAIATDSGGNMFFICSATAPLATSVLTTKLPTDGSMTGTHAPYTYATLTLSESAGTLTSTTASVPGSTPSFTSTNGALVASGASLVPTTIEVA